MLQFQEHKPGYSPPVYWPENGAPPRLNDAELDVTCPTEALTCTTVACIPVALAEPYKAPNPYTNSYVRSFDSALMVELGGNGFVSETWAVKWGYLSAPLKTPEAVEGRKVARAARKAARARSKSPRRRMAIN